MTMIDEHFEFLDEQDEISEPYWTLRRFIYSLIILITLVAFIVYVLAPLFTPPIAPVLSPLPRQQV